MNIHINISKLINEMVSEYFLMILPQTAMADGTSMLELSLSPTLEMADSFPGCCQVLGIIYCSSLALQFCVFQMLCG